MTEIKPTRNPLAQIALAVLNTGHPGPMSRGLSQMGAHRRFTRRYRNFSSRFVLFLFGSLGPGWQCSRFNQALTRKWVERLGQQLAQ